MPGRRERHRVGRRRERLSMDLTIPLATLVVLVALALAFDFMNGFHDAANSIATVVSTGVLRPHQAVIWAAFFNFVAIFIFHLKVAATVGKGIVDPACDRPLRDLRRAGRRDRLEPDHLVLRHPVELLARADRRHDRRDARQGGHRAAARAGHRQDRDLHRRLAAARDDARCAADDRGVLGLSARLRHGAWTAGSGACSSSRRRCTASATAATTRRRPWASSGCC